MTASTELQSARRPTLSGPAVAYRTARAQRSRTQPPLLHPMADTPPARAKAAPRSERSGAVGAMALGPVKMGIQDLDGERGGASSETSQLRPRRGPHPSLLYTLHNKVQYGDRELASLVVRGKTTPIQMYFHASIVSTTRGSRRPHPVSEFR